MTEEESYQAMEDFINSPASASRGKIRFGFVAVHNRMPCSKDITILIEDDPNRSFADMDDEAYEAAWAKAAAYFGTDDFELDAE